MAWIESHESLPTHPKTKRMCRLLKITPVVAVGHLHFLWWWAMNHAQDGVLDRYTPDDVADACSWEGDPDSFFDALVESKFIDRTSAGHEIHDWFVYAGKLIALRQKDAERKRTSRGKKIESEGSPADIPRTSNGSLTESIRDLNPNPLLIPIPDSDECGEMFKKFWKAYPNKHGKADAERKWKIYYRDKKLNFTEVMDGLEQYIEFCKVKDRPLKDGSTFVNSRAWEDDWTIKQSFNPRNTTSTLEQTELTQERIDFLADVERKQRERNKIAGTIRGTTRDFDIVS